MIIVTYTDGEVEKFDTIEDAEDGILETVTGCDFAVTVASVFEEGKREVCCSWTVKLYPRIPLAHLLAGPEVPVTELDEFRK